MQKQAPLPSACLAEKLRVYRYSWAPSVSRYTLKKNVNFRKESYLCQVSYRTKLLEFLPRESLSHGQRQSSIHYEYYPKPLSYHFHLFIGGRCVHFTFIVPSYIIISRLSATNVVLVPSCHLSIRIAPVVGPIHRAVVFVCRHGTHHFAGRFCFLDKRKYRTI